MSNLTKYPLEDGFETSLAQSWDGQLGAINVNATPNFTFPAGVTTYVVVEPGKTNMQIAEINAYSVGLKTLTASNITLEKGAGINSTAQVHPVGSKVIISDNYEFWSKIAAAINSKLDNNGGNTTTTWDLQVAGSNFRIRKDGTDMKFTDDNNAEISLSTIAAAAGVDTKVAISTNDTTPSQLEDKLTAGDGLSITKVNPGANESLDLDVNTSDTTIFVKTSSGAGDEDKVPTLDSNGELDSRFLGGPSKQQELVTYGESITAGDVVSIKTDGQAYKWEGYLNSGTAFTSDANSGSIRSVMIDTNTILVVHTDTALNDTKLRAGTIVGETITYGTEVTVDATTTGSSLAIVKTSTNKGVVFYKASTVAFDAAPFTVSGNTITLGTPITVNGTGSSLGTTISCATIDTDKVIFAYTSGAATSDQNTRVGTIAGNSITLGTELVDSFAVPITHPNIVKLDTNKALLCGVDGSSDMRVAVMTISGTVITENGNDTETGTINNLSVYPVSTDLALAVYDDTDIISTYISVSSTTPTIQAENVVKSATTVSGVTPPGILLNGNTLGVLHADIITWSLKNDSTYIITPIEDINYQTKSGLTINFSISNFIIFGESNFFVNDGVSKLTHLGNYDSHYIIGYAEESGIITESKFITLNGGINTAQSGMALGSKQFIQNTGGTGLKNKNSTGLVLGGQAISATDLLVHIPLEDI